MIARCPRPRPPPTPEKKARELARASMRRSPCSLQWVILRREIVERTTSRTNWELSPLETQPQKKMCGDKKKRTRSYQVSCAAHSSSSSTTSTIILIDTARTVVKPLSLKSGRSSSDTTPPQSHQPRLLFSVLSTLPATVFHRPQFSSHQVTKGVHKKKTLLDTTPNKRPPSSPPSPPLLDLSETKEEKKHRTVL